MGNADASSTIMTILYIFLTSFLTTKPSIKF
jgi:hypothetical protein